MKKNQIIVFCILLTLTIPSVNGQDNNIITDKRVSTSMAGEGDPWEVLTDDLEKILLAFHKGYTLSDIATAYKMDENEFKTLLEPLVKSNIITKREGDYLPNILIATEEEASKVYERVKVSADIITQNVQKKWNDIEMYYNKLGVSKTKSLKELGFMFVGSRILDIGVLRALAQSEELLLPAPLRPTPSYPNSRYYLWIEENSPDKFGYGQKDAELKFENWYVVNFGSDNESRYKLEEMAVELIESGKYDSPEHYAQLIGASYIDKNDTKKWEDCVIEISDILLKNLIEEKEEIKELHKTLRISQYSENTFDDFYCWYYHYVYPIVINNLIANDLFGMPQDKHTTVVIYNTKENGVLYID